MDRSQDLEASVSALAARARGAARMLAPVARAQKDAALRAIAAHLRSGAEALIAENARDLAAARAGGMKEALVDRLALDRARIEAMADAVVFVSDLPDPVGDLLSESVRPNGIRVRRVRVPIGVIAMIYESRPNVTAEASALCLKAGNAVILRGGSEAIHSNQAIARCIAAALEEVRLPADLVQVVPFTDREAMKILLRQTENIDLAIPRGGEALIRFVTENARVPVVQHYKGVCHLYVDGGADLDMAIAFAIDGKVKRPGVCNALECLLVDAADAARLLPAIARSLLAAGCELRGDEATRALVPEAKIARETDYGFEFLDKILAVRVVDGIEGAIAHVTRYGSGHTEAICTKSEPNAELWRARVDAACVAVNVSTRFHDGGELGLGAEIGIATSRLHWRGAMGLESLTTMKWLVDGTGQIRG